MTSAGRSFAVLMASGVAIVANALCGFVAFLVLPFVADGPAAFSASALRLGAAVALAILATLAIGRGAARLRRQLGASRELERRVASGALPITPRLRRAARDVGLSGRVVLVRSTERFSFAFGAFAPRVAISTGFLARLGDDELVAALAHERHHVRRLDPLRGALATLVAETLLLPVLRALRDDYELRRELDADCEAAAASGAEALARALLEALDPGHPRPEAAVALSSSRLLAARLGQLEGNAGPPPSIAWQRSFALSATGVLGVLALIGLALGTGPTRAALAPASLLEGVALCVAPLLLAGSSLGCFLRRRAAAPLP